MRKTASALALALTTSAVHAACPAASDMANGVVLTLSDGQVETHKTIAKDMVQVDVRFNDGTQDGSVMQFGHGLYLRNVIPIEDGVLRVAQQEKYASDATLRKWAAPKPNAAWSNTRSDGGTAQSGAFRTISVGGCRYDGFDVTLSFADDPNYVEVYAYIPSLGIGLLTEIIEDGGRDTYSYVSLTTK